MSTSWTLDDVDLVRLDIIASRLALALKPGDVVDLDQPTLFDVASHRAIAVDNTLFPTPYSNGRIEWRKDSRAFTFEYNQRGHQVYRVIEVNAATVTARKTPTTAPTNGRSPVWRSVRKAPVSVLAVTTPMGWPVAARPRTSSSAPGKQRVLSSWWASQ